QFHQYYPIRWLSLSKPGWRHSGFNFSQASTGSAHGASGKPAKVGIFSKKQTCQSKRLSLKNVTKRQVLRRAW
ncbi:MAG: hypothetical protein OXC48_08575, partial [Endozoicomonadaceae bacterium]|nr:hypothetical protein [Endozoicomonadaceae bacterium]